MKTNAEGALFLLGRWVTLVLLCLQCLMFVCQVVLDHLPADIQFAKICCCCAVGYSSRRGVNMSGAGVPGLGNRPVLSACQPRGREVEGCRF